MSKALVVVTFFLAACSRAGGSFDVESKAGERVIGHCVTDSTSVESVAYQERNADLGKATEAASSVQGFRFLSVLEQEYRYGIYVPARPGAIEYHVVCPWDRTKESCLVAGRFSGGNFEAYTNFETAAHAEEAAKAAFRSCTGFDG